MRSVREVEVPTVMAEAVVVGLDVLPSPVLRGQFAVARIEIGDVFAFVVMERPREAIVFGPTCTGCMILLSKVLTFCE